MNILIIGSKGFVGSACLQHFAVKHTVFGADIVASDEANYFRITGKESFDAVFSSRKFDVCINASGSAHVGFSFEHPEKDYELNVRNVELLLEGIRIHQPGCRMINFSSAAVYGNPQSLPVHEDAATQPLSPYGKHKLEAEQVLTKYTVAFKLRTCSLRVFSAYGPQLRKQLFWDIFQKWKKDHNVELFGTGNESRDFIIIDDLVRAVETVVAKAPFKGECINVSSGVETTINEAATLFLEALGEPFTLRFSGEVKSGDPVNWKADISNLNKLGFVPEVSFAEGIQRLAVAYKGLNLANEAS